MTSIFDPVKIIIVFTVYHLFATVPISEGSSTIIKMLTGFALALSLLFTATILFILIYFVSYTSGGGPEGRITNYLLCLSFQLILLWDLECDYMNANQCCAKLNFWVIPKISLHVFVIICLLVAKSWWLTALNVPMILYLIYEGHWALPRSSLGLYDPGEIHNRGMIRLHIRNCILNCAFYLILFSLYLYWYVKREWMREGTFM